MALTRWSISPSTFRTSALTAIPRVSAGDVAVAIETPGSVWTGGATSFLCPWIYPSARPSAGSEVPLMPRQPPSDVLAETWIVIVKHLALPARALAGTLSDAGAAAEPLPPGKPRASPLSPAILPAGRGDPRRAGGCPCAKYWTILRMDVALGPARDCRYLLP